MTKNIAVFKNACMDEKIYVLASGASLDFFPREIFDGEIVIAVNEMYRHAFSDYVLMHHSENAQEAIDAGCVLVTSDRAYDFPRWGQAPNFVGDYYTYRTTGYDLSLQPSIDLEHVRNRKDDELVVSACTTAEALQFAQHLGASAIILCGADGGTLDRQINLAGYNGGAATNPQHIRLTEQILIDVANVIRSQGTPVVSLNPFINFGLEGHHYERPKVYHGERLARELSIVHWNTIETPEHSEVP